MRHLCHLTMLGALLTNVPVAGAELATTIDPVSVTMPDLKFAATPQNEADFDKYFYFNRADTSFAEALAAITDCDLLASGLSSGQGSQMIYVPYATPASIMGAGIAAGIMGAIAGSAEKRRVRRVNMRRCMHYKGYQRYGLEKELWQKFNFEEGFSGTAVDERRMKLAQQAMVASGPAPATAGLGL